MEATIVNWGCIRIVENRMEATIVYWAEYLGPLQSEKIEAEAP